MNKKELEIISKDVIDKLAEAVSQRINVKMEDVSIEVEDPATGEEMIASVSISQAVEAIRSIVDPSYEDTELIWALYNELSAKQWLNDAMASKQVEETVEENVEEIQDTVVEDTNAAEVIEETVVSETGETEETEVIDENVSIEMKKEFSDSIKSKINPLKINKVESINMSSQSNGWGRLKQKLGKK